MPTAMSMPAALRKGVVSGVSVPVLVPVLPVLPVPPVPVAPVPVVPVPVVPLPVVVVVVVEPELEPYSF